MKIISSFASITFILIIIISHNILANTISKTKLKHSKISSYKSMLHAFTYLSKYGYNSCKNQSNSNNDKGKANHCQSNIESMIKEFQTSYQLLLSRKHNQKILNRMKPARCGVKDGPLFYVTENQW